MCGFCFFYAISIFLLTIIYTQSNGENLIVGLNERLDQFGICSIRITANFSSNLEFEPFNVPVTLIDVVNRLKSIPSRLDEEKYVVRHGLSFKYRELKCILDLIIHLGVEPFDKSKYWHGINQGLDYMDPKYLVMIRQHTTFLFEDHRNFWEFLKDHMIFAWTVIQQSSEVEKIREVQFNEVFFFCWCPLCEMSQDPPGLYPLEKLRKETNIRTFSDSLANKIRKQVFWVKYVPNHKLARRTTFPYDERSLNEDLSSDFYQFITNMLTRTNVSEPSLKINIIRFMKSNLRWGVGTILDETDGFNFIICHTSDTFWSIAQLFLRPYQPLVWTGLGVTLLASGFLLIADNVFGKIKISVSKLASSIVFNLVEVGVNSMNIHRNKATVKIMFASWLLMSIILTNSYKGLIISYLSLPWTPQQDHNYFLQLKGFKFYAPVPHDFDRVYWDSCNIHSPEFLSMKMSCNEWNSPMSSLGSYMLTRITDYRDLTRVMFNFNTPMAFPKNESLQVYQKLVDTEKLAIVSYTSELHGIMLDLKAKFKENWFFKGKENLWPHFRGWNFFKISYSQAPAELIQLMESGIYQFWKYWLRFRRHIQSELKDNSDNSPHALSLSSNVSFVFVILIIGVMTAAAIFLVENISFGFARLKIHLRLKTTWSNFSQMITTNKCKLKFFCMFAKSSTLYRLRKIVVQPVATCTLEPLQVTDRTVLGQ